MILSLRRSPERASSVQKNGVYLHAFQPFGRQGEGIVAEEQKIRLPALRDAPAPAEECSEQLKAKIIAEYLASAAKNTGVPLMTGGVTVAAPRKTAATVSEAGRLAQQFLNKRR